MADFNVRSDSVNVEQIMEQIRARIREKRGVDYTEQQIRELAAVKLEKFIDPRGVRSDLLEQFKQTRSAETAPRNYVFEDDTIFETHRAPIRWLRRLLLPVLKLFFNPNPIIQALHIQAQLNASRHGLDELQFEVLHNLVIETTRLGIEVKNLKMRVESFASRLEFNERRARALESVVVYKPAPEDHAEAAPRTAERTETRPSQPPASAPPAMARPAADVVQPPSANVPSGSPAGAVTEGPGQRSRRRRRRRGRRGGGSAAAIMAGAPAPAGEAHETDLEAAETADQAESDTSSGSSGDDEAAREVAAPHDTATESVEQALAAESFPTEPPAPPSGFGPDDDQ